MSQPTILITGGSGKFGRQYIDHFIKKDWTVIFTSTDKDRIDEVKSAYDPTANLYGIEVNLLAEGAAQQCLENINGAGHHINHLVNNARSLRSLTVSKSGVTSRSDFMAEYLMDVVAPYEMAICLYNSHPETLETITNISSQYAIVAATPSLYADYPKQSPIQYGVAKAGLNHMTKELAIRFADRQIRVNCIAYGGVEGRVDEDFEKRYAKLSPIKRMLKVSEIAGPLDFLVSNASSAMTGQTIVVDGGWTLW